MCKAIGSIFLLFTAFFYSSKRQKTEKQKIRILTELRELILHIRKNIECFAKPLGEICRDYTSPALEQIGFHLLWRSGRLQEAVSCLNEYVCPQACKVLQRYAQEAGQGYKEEELRLCGYTADMLSEILQKEEGELNSRTKLYRTLPYLLALSLVLVLY